MVSKKPFAENFWTKKKKDLQGNFGNKIFDEYINILAEKLEEEKFSKKHLHRNVCRNVWTFKQP